MVTKAKKALLASLAAFLCVMLTVFGLSMSVSLSETAKAADETTTEVAEVSGVKFATLAEAIAAAKDGDTVTLLADATEDVVVDKNITLDLGGKTLTGTNSGYATLSIQNGATTTIKNGSIVGSTSYYTIEIIKGSNATATFENLTATAGNTGSSMIDNWGTLTITSGTYKGGLNVVKSEEGSTLVINGGKFTLAYSEDGYTGVILVYGDTTINGGEFIQSLTSCGRWDHPQVIATGVVEGYTATTKVTGGSFTNLCSGEGIFRGVGKGTSDNFKVSGGTFNKAISADYCVDGFIPTKNADGTYGVKEGKYVAKVGSKKYETLADAIRLAAKGKTVTLLANVADFEGAVVTKNLTFDFGDYTITGKTGATVLKVENAKVTLNGNNGGIDGGAGGNNVAVWANTGAEVTINGGVYTVGADAKGLGNSTVYVTDNGKVTINGGTFSSKAAYNGKYYVLNVDNSAKGTFEVKGGTFKDFDPLSGDDNLGGNFAPEGYGANCDKNGNFTIVAGVVAQVKDKNGKSVKAYATLAEAIAAAPRNATVKLLANTRENVTIAEMLITLDLNGYTINGGTEKGKPAVTVTANGVTIKDSSADQTGTIMREDTAENSGVSSHYVIDVQGAGRLIFESGNVINHSGNNEGKGASLVRVGDASVAKQPGLVINGGTFTQDNFIVIKVGRGYFTLNGGTLNSANTYAIENWFNATVKGGTVNGAVSSWTYSDGVNSTLTISGGTINGDVTSVNYGNATDKKAKVSVTDGTINGKLDTRSYDPATRKLTSINDAAKATIEVSGGTFKNAVPTEYCAEGFIPTKNANGTFGVEKHEKVYLAKVGKTSYYTMEEAFEAQTASGEAIVLLRDYTTVSKFKSGRINRVVDLNGHTWTYTFIDINSAAFEINYPNVTLTVKNGKIISNSLVGLIPSVEGGSTKYDNAGLVFEGVDMTSNSGSGIETNGTNTNDSVTLKNSTLNVPNGFGIYFPSSGTLTINNSTINAKTMGVQVCSGELNINAGSAITVKGDAVPKAENDGAIQDGAAISIVNRPGYKGLSNIVITGGKFTAKGENKALKAYNWANLTESAFTLAEKVAVSGGAFTSAVPAEYCAEGFIPTKNADGTFGVKVGTYVAKIGEAGYETLAEAIAAAKYGETVKLLADIDGNLVIEAGKDFTLDLNGYTINGGTGTAEAAITNYGTLTITDSSAAKLGTITRGDNGVEGETSYYVILNLGTMTIEQANVVNNSGHDGSSLIRNGGNDTKVSTLTINGGEFTQNDFIAIKNDSTAVLNINGGIINSKNESAVQNWSTAHILGGTLNGVLWTLTYDETTIGKTVFGGEAVLNGRIYAEKYSQNVTVEPYVSITGGTLNVTEYKVENSEYLKVSGGTFSSEVNKDYLAKGYRLTKTGDSYSATEKYIASSTVSLGVDLSFKYEMVKGKSVNRVVASYYKVNETEATEYELTNVTIDGVVYYVFNGITPQMIDRKISVNVYVGNTVIYDVVEYSILDNLGAVLKKELGSKQDVTRQLVASLAYYGKAAMEYVKYDSSAVQKFIDDNKLSPLTAEIKDGVVAEYDPNETKIARISVQFADTNKVLVGVDEKVFDNYNYTIMVNGQEITSIDWQTGVVSGYNVYVSEGFAARYITDASKYVEVEVRDKNNNNNRVQYVKYNVAGYCMMMKDNATMGALATATYYYGVAAANYAA